MARKQGYAEAKAYRSFEWQCGNNAPALKSVPERQKKVERLIYNLWGSQLWRPQGAKVNPRATIGTPKGDRVDHNPQPDHTLQGG